MEKVGTYAWQELESALPLEAVTLGAQLGHLAGAKVTLDPSLPISLPDELMHAITLIKPNAREPEALTGFQVTDRNSARQAGKQLLERGAGAMAVQAGNEGNLIITSDDEQWFSKLPIQNIDATGAGNAFAAALTVALLEERPWQEVGMWASGAAALKTTKLGAQAGLPTRDQVLALLAKEGNEN